MSNDSSFEDLSILKTTPISRTLTNYLNYAKEYVNECQISISKRNKIQASEIESQRLAYEIDCWNKSTKPFDEREKEVKEISAKMSLVHSSYVKKKEKERSLEDALDDAKVKTETREQQIINSLLAKCRILILLVLL